jgi:uncharacterized membrane protein required for colicin V production
MNIQEGGRRLVATISWVVAIRIWIGWFIVFEGAYPIWWLIGLAVGFLARFICSRICTWILEGFVGTDEKGDSNND